MRSTTEIKPCRSCGEKPKRVHLWDEDLRLGGVAVVCANPGCRDYKADFNGPYWTAESDAIKDWNNRAGGKARSMEIADLKHEIMKLVKEQYQLGVKDGREGEEAFEDGFDGDCSMMISDIFAQLGIDDDRLEEIIAAERDGRCLVIPAGWESAREFYRLANMPWRCNEDGDGCDGCRYETSDGNCTFKPHAARVSLGAMCKAWRTLQGLRLTKAEVEAEIERHETAQQECIDALDGVRKCRVCGCTDDHACPSGCWWVEANLCSACADKAAPAGRP